MGLVHLKKLWSSLATLSGPQIFPCGRVEISPLIWVLRLNATSSGPAWALSPLSFFLQVFFIVPNKNCACLCVLAMIFGVLCASTPRRFAKVAELPMRNSPCSRLGQLPHLLPESHHGLCLFVFWRDSEQWSGDNYAPPKFYSSSAITKCRPRPASGEPCGSRCSVFLYPVTPSSWQN